jgi:hypothetical protein
MSTDVSEVRGASIIRAMGQFIALIMETVRTSEMSVNVTTGRYIPEGPIFLIVTQLVKKSLEAQNLLGCTAVFLIRCRPTFQRCVVPPSSRRWGNSSP